MDHLLEIGQVVGDQGARALRRVAPRQLLERPVKRCVRGLGITETDLRGALDEAAGSNPGVFGALRSPRTARQTAQEGAGCSARLRATGPGE